MSGFTDITLAKFLNDLLRGVSPGWPAALYVGLSTTAPTQTGGNITEIAWTGYARQPLTRGTGTWAAAAWDAVDARIESASAVLVDFGAAGSGVSGTAVAMVIYDAVSGGTPLAWIDLASPTTITTGNPVTIPIGNLTAYLANG